MKNYNTFGFVFTLIFLGLTAAPWLANLYGQHHINVEDHQQGYWDLLYPFHGSLICLPQLHVKSSEKIRKREIEFHIRKASGLNEDRFSCIRCPLWGHHLLQTDTLPRPFGEWYEPFLQFFPFFAKPALGYEPFRKLEKFGIVVS